jgi:small-conductance mechanosensitive channel
MSLVVVRVSASYQSDPEQVCDILRKIGSECPLIVRDPPPAVVFDNFGASGLEFSLRAATRDESETGAAETDLRIRILKAFRAAGIEMPVAQHDVHLRDLDVVRTLVARLAEERARRGETSPDDGRKD